MINEERFWEAAIAEAVSDKPAPDVTGRVLTALATEEEAPKTRGRTRFLRWGLELAAAAAVVVSIGLATGIIKLPGGEGGDEMLPPREVAAAPGAEYEFKAGIIELKSGWLLVTTGAPTVFCEGSELSKVDGRVLVHAGSMPPGERPEPVANWLKANNVETDMVNNIRHWVKGVGLAALVLSGTAMLDGQEIKSPEPQPQSTPEWHVIRSVMDIDNLPDDAKYVTAEKINAAHLDFLAEVESLEGIRIRGCFELRSEHLGALKGLKHLRLLDIRDAEWMHKPDLTPLLELKALSRLGADLIPTAWHEDGTRFYRQGERIRTRTQAEVPFSYRDSILPVFAELSKRGVEIEIGAWNPVSQEDLGSVLETLPTMRAICIYSPSVGEMKALSRHENLRCIEIYDYTEGQIGLAYLARSAKLEELTLVSNSISIDEIHQISRMKLRLLCLYGELASSPERCFELLASMKTLDDLDIGGFGLSDSTLVAFRKFTGRESLQRVWIRDDLFSGDAFGCELLIAQHVPVKQVILSTEYIGLVQQDWIPESLRSGEAAAEVEVIRFECREAAFDGADLNPEHAVMFQSFPNVKRVEVRRGGFENPSMEDQFVNWLKDILPKAEVVVTP